MSLNLEAEVIVITHGKYFSLSESQEMILDFIYCHKALTTNKRPIIHLKKTAISTF